LEVYSNLSLQILSKDDNIKYYYDEYLSFSNNINDNIKVIHIDNYFKPILDIELLKNCIEKFKESSNIYLITNDLNHFQLKNKSDLFFELINNFKLNYISIESILGSDYFEDCSVKNLIEFQFPYNYTQQKKINELYKRIFKLERLPRVKVICVDFDNTLFEGVIGELNSNYDVFKNSKSIFYVFHEFLKKLKNSGFLLCLVTKNNHSDIELFFKKNKMPLQIEDFIVIKANWNNKSMNINDISDSLSLDTNTFLFIDDSDFEIEEVNINVPNIRTIKFVNDIEHFKEHFLNNPLFFKGSITDEDINKTSIYKEEFKRKSKMKKAKIIDDEYNLSLFNLLEIELQFKKNNEIDIQRVIQMSEKTNQFNFNKLKLNKSDILKFLKQGYDIFTCSSKDKYGDYGVIGYIIFNESNQILNYVISCRALSRHIEYKFLDYCIKKQKIKNLTFFFKKTERNKPASLFLNSLKEYYEGKDKVIRIKNLY